MAADAGIFSQYMQPVRSVADYAGDMDKKEQNALTLAALRMKGQQDQQTMQDSQTARQLAQGYGSDMNALSQAYMKAGLIPQAQALQKSILDQQKTQADILHTGAQTRQGNAAADGLQAKQKYEAAANHAQKLAYVRTPEDVISYFDQGIANGVFPAQDREKMIQQANQYPTLESWKQAEGSASIPVLERYKEAASMDRTRLQTNTQLATNAATVANSARTADLNDVRQRDMNTAKIEENRLKAQAASTTAKPLPAAALKMQQTSLDAINIASNTQADLGAIEQQIKDGNLKFGMISNLANRGLNATGLSTEESRNFASFKSSLETLRNNSLRLNAGVQTDGDAQRAWNELFDNINDTGVVKQRLAEIKRLNARAVVQHKLNIDGIRSNYGHAPMDTSGYESQGAAVGATGSWDDAKALGAPTRIKNAADYASVKSGDTYIDPNGQMRKKP